MCAYVCVCVCVRVCVCVCEYVKPPTDLDTQISAQIKLIRITKSFTQVQYMAFIYFI